MFDHLVVMDESADARRIVRPVPQSDWRRPFGRPHTSWLAEVKNNLSSHNLIADQANELALNKPLWGLFSGNGAVH